MRNKLKIAKTAGVGNRPHIRHIQLCDSVITTVSAIHTVAPRAEDKRADLSRRSIIKDRFGDLYDRKMFIIIAIAMINVHVQ